MSQPRKRPPRRIREMKSAPGSSTKTDRERINEAPMKGNVMTSIATNTPAMPWDGYEFAAWAELTGPAGDRVQVTTNWDKEAIQFPVEHLAQVIEALQSLKCELTGKRG